MRNRQHNTGITLILTLVFGGIFLITTTGLFSLIFAQHNIIQVKVAREKAFNIAEAGLEYYRWFLAHNPDDIQDGTGGSGPYVHNYADSDGETIGNFSLDISGNFSCGQLQSIDIVSTGISSDYPQFKRVLSTRYSRPSVAEYAYIYDAAVWAGSTRDIVGPYHGNNGVRMDGTNHSLVTSSVATWLCDSGFDCSPSQTVPGVYGLGSETLLWKYPVEEIDFDTMSTDLSVMKGYAQADGLYFDSYSGGYEWWGYRLKFKNDGTVDVSKVSWTSYDWGYDSTFGWVQDYHTINSETAVVNYAIPSDCSLIYVEDRVWLEGTVKGKITLVVADVVHSGYDPDVIIHDDILYTTNDGTDGLTVIAENNILISARSPDDLEMNGIFVAQNGKFGRNGYDSPSTGWWGIPTYLRDQLTINGSIVSKRRGGTAWGSGTPPASGYSNRDTTYDRLLATDPPPFTPFMSENYRFIKWRED